MKDRNTGEGFLRDLDTRLARLERHTHSRGGGMRISDDSNNATLVGNDGGAYSREIVAKDTEPTTYDFGGHLVIGSIWVQLGVGEVCTPIVDDFARTDLGPDWALPGGTVYDPFGTVLTTQHLTIASDAAIGPVTAGTANGIDFRTEPLGPQGGHYGEVTFTLASGAMPSSTLSEVLLYLLFDPISWTGIGAWILQNNDGPFGGFRVRFVNWINGGAPADSSYDYFHEWPTSGHTATLRFEATVDGLVSAYLGGTLVDVGAGDGSYQFSIGDLGDQVGLSTRVAGTTMPVPRVEVVEFGCLELA